MVTLFLIFKGAPILFSIVAVPIYIPTNCAGFSDGSDGKESACSAGDPGREDPLEKEVATHSSILA